MISKEYGRHFKTPVVTSLQIGALQMGVTTLGFRRTITNAGRAKGIIIRCIGAAGSEIKVVRRCPVNSGVMLCNGIEKNIGTAQAEIESQFCVPQRVRLKTENATDCSN
jgi:hypothetical protein